MTRISSSSRLTRQKNDRNIDRRTLLNNRKRILLIIIATAATCLSLDSNRGIVVDAASSDRVTSPRSCFVPPAFKCPAKHTQHHYSSLNAISSRRSPQRKRQQLGRETSTSRLTEKVPSSTTSAIQLLIGCFAVALACIAWEDVSGQYVLPSRRTRVMVVEQRQADERVGSGSFGQVSVKGMGFGREERLLLMESMRGTMPETKRIGSQDINSIDRTRIDEEQWQRRSYNEIMLEHRQERIPRWRQVQQEPKVLPTELADAIHTLCVTLQSVQHMRELALDYQWESIRILLQAPADQLGLDQREATIPSLLPCTNSLSNQLEQATILLRSELDTKSPLSANKLDVTEEDTIGFPWASCAWRHQCGALADAQEALDELDAKLGLLEPFEAIFCLDVAERSLRDMLTLVTSNRAIMTSHILSDKDERFLSNLAPYQPLHQYEPLSMQDGILTNEGVSADGEASIDDEYLKTIRELRMDP